MVWEAPLVIIVLNECYRPRRLWVSVNIARGLIVWGCTTYVGLPFLRLQRPSLDRTSTSHLDSNPLSVRFCPYEVSVV